MEKLSGCDDLDKKDPHKYKEFYEKNPEIYIDINKINHNYLKYDVFKKTLKKMGDADYFTALSDKKEIKIKMIKGKGLILGLADENFNSCKNNYFGFRLPYYFDLASAVKGSYYDYKNLNIENDIKKVEEITMKFDEKNNALKLLFDDKETDYVFNNIDKKLKYKLAICLIKKGDKIKFL